MGGVSFLFCKECIEFDGIYKKETVSSFFLYIKTGDLEKGGHT